MKPQGRNVRLHYTTVSFLIIKGKVKVSCLTPVAKQAKTAFFNRPAVWNVAHCGGSNPHLSLQKGCTTHFIHKTPRVQSFPISNSQLVFSVWEPQGASQLWSEQPLETQSDF